MKNALYYMDFLVMDWILEKDGALREMYLTLHEGVDDIEEGEIEWFRKRYTEEPAPLYSFIFIARGEFFIHFLSHDPLSDNEINELKEYGLKNYHAYVDEFYQYNRNKAPLFRMGVIVMA